MYFQRLQNHISQKRLFQYVLSPLPDKWKAPWGRGAARASFAAVNIILFHFLCRHKTFSTLLRWTEFNFCKIFDWWNLMLVCIGQLFVGLTSAQWAQDNHHMNFSQFDSSNFADFLLCRIQFNFWKEKKYFICFQDLSSPWEMRQR